MSDTQEIKLEAPNFNGDLNLQDIVKNTDLLIRAYALLKNSVSTAPTYTPHNFYDSIVLYVNGVTYRLYIYIPDSWYYVTLTKA